MLYTVVEIFIFQIKQIFLEMTSRFVLNEHFRKKRGMTKENNVF